MLPDLSFARLRFTYRLRDSLSHGLFQGSLWRGALGYALKKTICIYADPFERRCAECALLHHCPYPPLFEPVTEERVGGAYNAPRPFVLEPPVYARRPPRAGEEVSLGLVLIGPALANLPAISRREVRSFGPHLRRYLLDRTIVHLGEHLKQRPEAWRAFNRFLLEGLQDGIKQLAEGQTAIVRRSEQLVGGQEQLRE